MFIKSGVCIKSGVFIRAKRVYNTDLTKKKVACLCVRAFVRACVCTLFNLVLEYIT